MGLLILTDDILRIIAEMLSAAECLPLSSASRRLHVTARKRVFASIPVGNVEQLVKSHDHLIHNIDNRLIWPRGVTIYVPPGKAVDALVGIFEHARESKALALYWDEAMI